MKARSVSVVVLALLGLIFFQTAHSQQPSAPKENNGFKATALQVVDLGAEIDGMKDRQLRMRMLTIEPGGHIGMHSHKDRPAVVYCLQGTDTITAEDGTVKFLRAGDSSSAHKDIAHWHRNDGKEPVVLILVDIFHNIK